MNSQERLSSRALIPNEKIPSMGDLSGVQRKFQRLLFATILAGVAYAPRANASVPKSADEAESISVDCNLKVVNNAVKAVCSKREEDIELEIPKQNFTKRGIDAQIRIMRDDIYYSCHGSFENPFLFQDDEGNVSDRTLNRLDDDLLVCDPPGAEDLRIEIDTQRKRLYAFQQGRKICPPDADENCEFPISAGREESRGENPASPTKPGRYKIGKKERSHRSIIRESSGEVNEYDIPLWTPLIAVSPGAGRGYGIHSIPVDLNDPKFAKKAAGYIGKYNASHGCIRLNPKGANFVFRRFPRKTSVDILDPSEQRNSRVIPKGKGRAKEAKIKARTST